MPGPNEVLPQNEGPRKGPLITAAKPEVKVTDDAPSRGPLDLLGRRASELAASRTSLLYGGDQNTDVVYMYDL